MNKLLLSLSLILLAVNSSAQIHIVDDLHAQSRDVRGSFNKIIIEGDIDVYLSQSASDAIAISASEQKFTEAIRTEIKNNTLKVYVSGDRQWHFKNRNLRAYISFREIAALEISGTSNVMVAGNIKGKTLALKISGASNFKGEVEMSELDIRLSGASDIHVSGNVSTLFVSSSGASDVNGLALNAIRCKVSASGASDIKVAVKDELTVEASGASEITYGGDPVVHKINMRGASIVKKG